MIAGARHRDVHQASFFLQLIVVAEGTRHREPAVHRPDDEHRVPLLPLGAVHGAEHQGIVLFFRAAAGEVLRPLGRLEGYRREEGAAIGVPPGNYLQLVEVREPRLHPVVPLTQDVVVQHADPRDVRPHLVSPRWPEPELREHFRQPGMCLTSARRRQEPVESVHRPRAFGHRRDRRASGGLPDARQELQQAEPTHFVARVFDDAQECQDILHVGRLEELEPTPLLERDLPVRQFDFEVRRHVGGPEQHRHFGQRDPLLVQLEDPLHHETGLLLLIGGGDEPGRLAPLAVRPEVLGEPLTGARDERVAGVQDRLRRAVVLLQRDHRGAVELPREFEDVAEAGAAERIDALRIVADHRDVAVAAAQPAKDSRLQDVGVLVFVDQDVVVKRRDPRSQRRMLEQQTPEHEQVVVVDQVPFRLPLGEVGIDAGEVRLEFRKPWELLGQDFGDRDLGVHVARVDVVQCLLARESALGVAIAKLGAGELHQVGRISLIHDREVTRESGGLAEPPE